MPIVCVFRKPIVEIVWRVGSRDDREEVLNVRVGVEVRQCQGIMQFSVLELIVEHVAFHIFIHCFWYDLSFSVFSCGNLLPQ